MLAAKRRGSEDAASESRLFGIWRITESDTWDAGCLDMVAPATMGIPPDGLGEFSFGVVTCATDIGFAGPDDIAFTFHGSGFAELGEDGVLEIEIAFDMGDDAVLKARRV